MRQQLSTLGDQSPKGVGDPLPGLRSEQSATLAKLQDDYGAEVARVVEEAIAGTWRGPVSSVYGLHFIRVTGKDPAYVPPLDVIGVEVRADWLREVRDELRKERMEALRDAYTVHIERVP
jgi:parvulin-like peptidyl-prolyl isomerase